MKARCRVRLVPGGPWRRGMLTDDRCPERWGPCVLVDCQPYAASAVDCVRVDSSCSVELLDAAVESGFWILGQPRVKR